MKAFIATSLKNVAEALRITSLLEEYGIEHQCCITELRNDKGVDLFDHNVQGIRDADVFFTIYKNVGRDTSAEIGIAFALGKRRIAVTYGGDQYATDTMIHYSVGDIITEEELPHVLDQLKNEAGDSLPFYVPNMKQYSTKVFRDLADVFETQQFVDGKYTKELERTLAERYGRHVITTSSGTTGLIATLDSLFYESPDKKEVIVPSLTFPATAQAILHAGGTPVYVDVKETTWNIDPKDTERKITDKTGVIIPVNTFGVPCDVDTLGEISKSYGIPLIYDSCQAFGSQTMNGEVGRFGDAEVFSLDVTKIVSGGLGGYVTTSRDDLLQRLRYAKNFGMDEQKAPVQLGINARMLEFSSILALHSLADAEKHLAEYHAQANRYVEYLREVNDIRFQEIPSGSIPSRNFFVVFLDREDARITQKVKQSLEEKGISSRIYVSGMLHEKEVLGIWK
ncbi:MAG: DegT/DnrJ/EryC1/StrS family aminotransferase [Thaumarchaeota archaeon]|nr:DegT/DnrJ/EryC1/StrS family aminotransferase [Nitrososphaerota archaeon]